MQGETPPTIRMGIFTSCKFVDDKAKGIYVPAGKADDYKTAWTDWQWYISDIPAPVEQHKHDDGMVFIEWAQKDSLPNTAGNYYLTENVTLSGTWNVPGGETTLCLNGKTIRVSGERVITIAPYSTLNLYDCRNAGNITDGASGGVYMENKN